MHITCIHLDVSYPAHCLPPSPPPPSSPSTAIAAPPLPEPIPTPRLHSRTNPAQINTLTCLLSYVSKAPSLLSSPSRSLLPLVLSRLPLKQTSISVLLFAFHWSVRVLCFPWSLGARGHVSLADSSTSVVLRHVHVSSIHSLTPSFSASLIVIFVAACLPPSRSSSQHAVSPVPQGLSSYRFNYIFPSTHFQSLLFYKLFNRFTQPYSYIHFSSTAFYESTPTPIHNTIVYSCIHLFILMFLLPLLIFPCFRAPGSCHS